MIALFNDIPFLWFFSFFLALYLLKCIFDYLFGRFVMPKVQRRIDRDRAELREVELEFFKSMSRRAGPPPLSIGPDPRDKIDALSYVNRDVDDFCDAVDTHPAGYPFPPLPRPRCIQLPLGEVLITEADIHRSTGFEDRIPPRPLK